MTNDPADKLAAPSFGFKKKKRGGTAPASAKTEKAPAQQAPTKKTQVLERTGAPVIAPEPTPTPVADTAADTVTDTVAEKTPLREKAPKQKTPKPPRPAKAPKAVNAPREPKAPKQPTASTRRPLNLPTPTGLSAAVVIGAIVGGFMSLAIWFSGTVSQWTRGTSSLGDMGAIILIAVFVLAVVAGGYLLRLTRARSPFTVSFLGSALVAVLSMLFLTDLFNHAWGVIVAVILTAAAYALASWITTKYID